MDLTEPVLLTTEGLEKLKRDLDVALKRRAEAGERLKEDFQPGDIEDNPEYEQAKEEVGLLDSRIYELQEMIGRAEIIKESHSSVAGPGSTIDVVDHEGSSETYHLVGAVESDPSAGRISVDSPVASALVDAGVQPGDSVILMSPNRLEWLYCDLGIQAAGAVTVPIYSGTPSEIAKKIVANCEAVLAITSGTELAATFEVGGPLKR